MDRFSSLLTCAFAGALLSGCIGIELPDPDDYLANCPDPVQDAEALDPDALFFVSTGLPDCRGDTLSFAFARHPQVSFGQTVVSPDINDPDSYTFSSQAYSEAAWQQLLADRLERGNNDRRVLVFVHGYNNTFEDALDGAWRTVSQYYAGVPVIVMRWPSGGAVTRYVYDEDSAIWTQRRMYRTLRELAAMDARITVVAHSMGSRIAINSVLDLDRAEPALSASIERIVLASADFDRHTAIREGGALERLLVGDRRILVYSSYRDVPLALSREAHGYARLGSSDCRYDVIYEERERGEEGDCHLAIPNANLAVVDTSQVASQGVLKHRDYLDSCAVRSDLAAFLRGAATFPLREPIERDGRVGYRITASLADEHTECAEPEG